MVQDRESMNDILINERNTMDIEYKKQEGYIYFSLFCVYL